MSVLLLKSNVASGNDNYVKQLTAANFKPQVVNTLCFRFHPDALKNLRIETYSCVVFTSVRAVEAFRNVLSGEIDSSVRCFCVGLATADKARLLGFHPEGFDSGNAETLASLIISTSSPETSRQVLFPCGTDRLDTIERRLTEAGFSVDARIVYSADKDPVLETALRSALENRPRAVVFFSPSAVRHSRPVIKEYSLKDVLVVSIGHSTTEALRAEGIQHISEMAKPTPYDLLEALGRA